MSIAFLASSPEGSLFMGARYISHHHGRALSWLVAPKAVYYS